MIEQLTFLLKIAALILLIMITVAALQRARADGHVIKPDCWEEQGRPGLSALRRASAEQKGRGAAAASCRAAAV
jgi:hypothetical protein